MDKDKDQPGEHCRPEESVVRDMGENWRRQKRGREIPVFFNLGPMFKYFGV